MAHGQPDFGMYAGKETIHGLSDMGELAVRLGSIDHFDRRGNVVFLDSFDAPSLRWLTALVGAGSSVALSTDVALSGDQSVKLVAGAGINFRALIHRWIEVPVASRFGIEVAFTSTIADSRFDLYLSLQQTGSRYHAMDVSYYQADKTLRIYIAGGGTQIIDTIDIREETSLFHILKLVGDFSTGKYVRLILDDVEYDISQYEVFTNVLASLSYLFVEIGAYSLAAVQSIYYVDNFILTQNEP